MRWWFSRSFTNLFNFLYASLKLLFLVCDWSVFSCADSNWVQRKWERIYLSHATSSIIFQNQKRLPVSIFSVFGTVYWKDFQKEQAKTLSLIFSSTKKQNNVKTAHVQKYLSLQKIFISWHNPLKHQRKRSLTESQFYRERSVNRVWSETGNYGVLQKGIPLRIFWTLLLRGVHCTVNLESSIIQLYRRNHNDD